MRSCPLCDELVLPDELEANEARELADGNQVHTECLMRQLVGSVGHQLGRCSCFGGTYEDPPGLTRRQAARIAWNHFLRSEAERN